MRYILNIYRVLFEVHGWKHQSRKPAFNQFSMLEDIYVEPVEPTPWCGDGSDSLRDHIWIWYEHMKQPMSATSKHQGSQQFSKLFYFVWSPPWHLYILLLANLLAFYLTYFLAFNLAFYLAYLLAFYLAYLLADVLAYLLADFWHIFWHIFWHMFWHIFWHSIWHSIWQIFWHIIWHIFWHSIWHTIWHSI